LADKMLDASCLSPCGLLNHSSGGCPSPDHDPLSRTMSWLKARRHRIGATPFTAKCRTKAPTN